MAHLAAVRLPGLRPGAYTSRMINFFDDPDIDRTRLRALLCGLARRRETATYQELAVSLDLAGRHRIHRLTAVLETLIREDHAAGRPLAAAMIVSRALDGLPQRGFFDLLGELGRYGGPPLGEAAAEAHGRELEAAWQYWAEPPIL